MHKRHTGHRREIEDESTQIIKCVKPGEEEALFVVEGIWQNRLALFLSQSCRILLNSDTKNFGHLKYWLGLYLRDYFPSMVAGPHAAIISPYFQHMRLLLVEGLVLGDVNAGSLKKVSAKFLYHEYTSSFPPPKVVFKLDVDWPVVWERLDSPVLDPTAREYLFMIIHNIVPNRERLYLKMNMVNNPCCIECNVREDNVHIFTECSMVQEAWFWVRSRLLSMLPETCSRTSNFEFLNFMFEKNTMDLEMIWLLSSVVSYIWSEKINRKRKVKLEHLIGHLQLQYRANQLSRKPRLGHIVGI